MCAERSSSYRCSLKKLSSPPRDIMSDLGIEVAPTSVAIEYLPCSRKHQLSEGNARLREASPEHRRQRGQACEGFRIDSCAACIKAALRSSGWQWRVLHEQQATLVLLPHAQARHLLQRLAWYRRKEDHERQFAQDQVRQDRRRIHQEEHLMLHRCGQPILVSAWYKVRLARRDKAFVQRYKHLGLAFFLPDSRIPVTSCPRCLLPLSLLSLAFSEDRAKAL